MLSANNIEQPCVGHLIYANGNTLVWKVKVRIISHLIGTTMPPLYLINNAGYPLYAFR